MAFSFRFQRDGLDKSDLLVFLEGKMELCVFWIKLYMYMFY